MLWYEKHRGENHGEANGRTKHDEMSAKLVLLFTIAATAPTVSTPLQAPVGSHIQAFPNHEIWRVPSTAAMEMVTAGHGVPDHQLLGNESFTMHQPATPQTRCNVVNKPAFSNSCDHAVRAAICTHNTLMACSYH